MTEEFGVSVRRKDDLLLFPSVYHPLNVTWDSQEENEIFGSVLVIVLVECRKYTIRPLTRYCYWRKGIGRKGENDQIQLCVFFVRIK
jgi:hypothetical protein